jgi:hypothetical protein
MPIQLALFDLSVYTVQLPREPSLLKEKFVQSNTGEYEQLELPLFSEQPQSEQQQSVKLAA